MKKIDDIFKKGLDNKGLDYTDAHWKSMALLLDENKAGFFTRNKWMLGIIGLLIISGGISFLVLNSTQDSLPTKHDIAESIVSEQVELPVELPNPTKKNDILEGSSISMNTTKKESNLSIDETPISNAINTSAEELKLTATNRIDEKIIVSEDDDDISNETSLKTSLLKRPIKFDIARLKPIGIPMFENQSSDQIDKIDFDKIRQNRAISVYMAASSELNSYTKSYDLLSEFELKESEKPIMSIGYSLDVLMKRKNWAIKTGVGVVSLKEQTNYKSTANTYGFDTSFQLINGQYALTPRGTRVALIEKRIDSFKTGTIDQIECVDCITQFKYITIPLAIQYELQKNRLIYYGEFGLAASFLSGSSGNYSFMSSKDSLDQLIIEDSKGNVNLSERLFYYHASFGLKYRLNSNVNAFASYGYRRGLNSMVAGYRQIPALSQIRIGFEWKISKD